VTVPSPKYFISGESGACPVTADTYIEELRKWKKQNTKQLHTKFGSYSAFSVVDTTTFSNRFWFVRRKTILIILVISDGTGGSRFECINGLSVGLSKHSGEVRGGEGGELGALL